ncbi:SoxR reducing system RseC family protein [Alkalilimnicola sp. S0819]|uniref:SoxR reducing system RseC family protein n=1 Tax=Alkalilimnicola sp. S0819 TaxID=2613922 RepID=UPI0012614574|nr:SoxR reducing system RseC family protein [Alkalilimnicola sp. S0819]KAB7627555.1 Fis family transcriptional regulator [Alkalilimnicola sp. S0819]MPQ15711.1 Fis family transcriptional regulator [Alkalilimnicola sp. S0819]
MLREEGRVVAVADGVAWVETQRRATCDSCAVNKGCGTGAMAKALGRKPLRIRVIDELGARIGEPVLIGLPEQALLSGSLAVYLVPLLLLLVFAALGDSLGRGQALVVLLGLVGLALGFAWVRLFGRRIARDPRYQPSLLRRLYGEQYDEA